MGRCFDMNPGELVYIYQLNKSISYILIFLIIDLGLYYFGSTDHMNIYDIIESHFLTALRYYIILAPAPSLYFIDHKITYIGSY